MYAWIKQCKAGRSRRNEHDQSTHIPCVNKDELNKNSSAGCFSLSWVSLLASFICQLRLKGRRAHPLRTQAGIICLPFTYKDTQRTVYLLSKSMLCMCLCWSTSSFPCCQRVLPPLHTTLQRVSGLETCIIHTQWDSFRWIVGVYSSDLYECLCVSSQELFDPDQQWREKRAASSGGEDGNIQGF